MLRLKLFFYIKLWLPSLSDIFFKFVFKIVNTPNRSFQEKLNYLNDPNKAKSIMRYANRFINQFKDESLQLEIAIRVITNYLRLLGRA
jgi:hypothetical protein